MSDNSAIQFSVVIATCNRKRLAAEAIQSVKNQTFPASQIIVVVDGDFDETEVYLRERFEDITLIVQSNLGPSVARNTGVAHAQHQFVCFLDDDDLWHKEKLEAIAKYIQDNPDAKAINSPAWFFYNPDEGPPREQFGMKADFAARNLDECHAAAESTDSSSNSFEYLLINGRSFELLLQKNRGTLSGAVIDRTTLIRAGCFPPSQAYGEDWTCFLNVARQCEWHTIPRRLVFYRFHSSQNTQDTLNAIYILAGYINAWFAGRPLRERTPKLTYITKLKDYGTEYRFFVQNGFWSALRSGRFTEAGLIAAMGLLLLPRNRDRLFAITPPQITWRFENYILKQRIIGSVQQK